MTAATENESPNTQLDGALEVKPEETKLEGGEETNSTIKEELKTEEEVKTEQDIKSEDSDIKDVKINIEGETTDEKEEIKQEKEEIIVTDGVEVDPGMSGKIMKQLEYYFGDRNLAKDRFMLREVTLDEGWISLSTMLNFKRLASITSDKAKIAKAVETSNSEIVVIHESSKSKIRRNPNKPLPQNSDQVVLTNNMKTVYIKGLPLTLTLDAIEEFVSPHGKTMFVKFRKDAQGQFKGSVFIEFAQQEDCDKFVKLENVMFGDSTEPLLILSRNDYFKSKNANQRSEKNEKREAQLGQGWNSAAQQNRVPDTLSFEKGRVVKILGLKGKDTSREDIKDLFDGQGLEWVTYNKGDEQAHIRFSGDAAAILEKVKVDGKFVLSEMELEVEVVVGEEEDTYYKEAAQQKSDFFNRPRKRKGDYGGRGRGNYKRNRRY